jgi:hypothetical protein
VDARTMSRLARIDPRLTIEGPNFSHKRGPPNLLSPDLLASPPSRIPRKKNAIRAATASNARRG